MQDDEQDGLRPVDYDDAYLGRTLQTMNEEEAHELAALYEKLRMRQRQVNEDLDDVGYWMVPVRVCRALR